MSFNLTVRFTGVNAYVFPDDEGEPLRVVMPNVTMLGKSPSSELAPHFPTVLGLDDLDPDLRSLSRTLRRDRTNTRGIYHYVPVRYLFWERLTINVYRMDQEGRAAEDRSIWESTRYQPVERPLRIPASTASDRPPVEKVAGQVRLYAGSVSVKDRCNLAWSNEKALVSSAAIVDELKVEIEDIDLVSLRFEGFFGGEDEIRINGDAVGADVDLRIGNLCAGNTFQWPTNNRHDFVDRDFGWLYQLTEPKLCAEFGPPPLPIVDAGACRFLPTDEIEELPARLKSHFGERFGGGGCGCECSGCRARLIADAKGEGY